MLDRKLKVLHLLASNSFSGAENVACQIISCFSDYDEAYCSPVGKIEEQLKSRGVKYIPIKKLSRKEVKRVLEEYQPDIIHAHDAKASVVASFSSKKIPIVSHIHCNDRKMSRIGFKSILFKLASKRFAHIFFVSGGSYKSFRFSKAIEDKSSVLRNVIDRNLAFDKVKRDENNYNYDIVYVGRLTEIKNPLRLVDIMVEAVKSNNNIKMGIIGDGELKGDLQNYINEKNMDNNVELLGFMQNPYKVISDSKIMLMTSISEGLPMCALEALALGVPIISTKTDGLKEIIHDGKTGFLYDEDSDAVVKMLDILQDEEKYDQIRANVIEFSQKYNDLEEYKKQIVEVYEKAMK